MSSSLATQHPHSMRRGLLRVGRAFVYVVYAVVIFVEIVLFLGFFLLLFGANPTSDFVEWIYRSLDRAMQPFRGIFTPIPLGEAPGGVVQSVFETSVLFAMIVYGLIALAIGGFVEWLTGRLHRLDQEAAEQQRLAALAQQPGAAPADTTAQRS